MSNILNPKPRFGYNPTTGMIYDYVAQKDVVPNNADYEALDGTWNLADVKTAIMAGQTIESAHTSVKAPTPATGSQPNPPSDKAMSTPSADAVNEQGTVARLKTEEGAPNKHHETGPDTETVPPKNGLSASQLQALKLSPLQAAALGLSPAQMNETGITETQFKGWALTSERADSLRLTDDQRKVLMR